MCLIQILKKISMNVPPCGNNHCINIFSNNQPLTQYQEPKRGNCLDYTQKDFAQKLQLSVHQRIYTSERFHLIAHQRTLIREKSSDCSKGGKTFSQESSLIIHQRIHAREKPYLCRECGRHFPRSPSLLYITELTLERRHLSALDMAKPSARSPTLLCFIWPDTEAQ